MELGACHECASGSNLAFHVDFCSQIHRVRIFCGGQRVFHSWNCSSFSPLLIWLPFFFPTIFAGWPSPTQFHRRLPGHVTFITLQVLFSRPTTDRASLATSLMLIGPLTPVPPGDSASPPEVTRCSSVPCRPQTPWCGG